MFKRKAAAVAPTPRARDATGATTASRDYLAQVTQLVDEQSAVLFTMVVAAAAQASTATAPIIVTREAHTLTASMDAQTAVFRIEAITDRPADMGRARTYMLGQARCILPTPDGPSAEWVLALQHSAAAGARHTHAWMDARGVQPVTEAVVASALRSIFA